MLSPARAVGNFDVHSFILHLVCMDKEKKQLNISQI